MADDDDLFPASPQTRRSSAGKTVRKVSPSYLMNSALYYLGRFSASRAGLRQVLQRKAWRSLQTHGGDSEEINGWIEATLTTLEQQGWLNDEAFAESRARSLNARGTAQRTIRQKLAQKGIDQDTIAHALDRLAEEHGSADAATSDRCAAVAYARRRRLGPWRLDPQARTERRDRDLAALARQGFSSEVARTVIDASTIADAEDWAEGD